ARGQRTPSSVYTRSSSDGSKRRPCCRQPIPLRCCSGRCSPQDRSTCAKLTVGRRLPQTPSINRLTSLPDSVLSKRRRSRHAEFQHIQRRHLGRGTKRETLSTGITNAFESPGRGRLASWMFSCASFSSDRHAFDAHGISALWPCVDGSSTGTEVPWMWVLLRPPRFGGATHASS